MKWITVVLDKRVGEAEATLIAREGGAILYFDKKSGDIRFKYPDGVIIWDIISDYFRYQELKEIAQKSTVSNPVMYTIKYTNSARMKDFLQNQQLNDIILWIDNDFGLFLNLEDFRDAGCPIE